MPQRGNCAPSSCCWTTSSRPSIRAARRAGSVAVSATRGDSRSCLRQRRTSSSRHGFGAAAAANHVRRAPSSCAVWRGATRDESVHCVVCVCVAPTAPRYCRGAGVLGSVSASSCSTTSVTVASVLCGGQAAVVHGRHVPAWPGRCCRAAARADTCAGTPVRWRDVSCNRSASGAREPGIVGEAPVAQDDVLEERKCTLVLVNGLHDPPLPASRADTHRHTHTSTTATCEKRSYAPHT